MSRSSFLGPQLDLERAKEREPISCLLDLPAF
jgi:hypothetical protein